jgi:hypothetical protein
MSITKHHTVLSALENQALRYRRKGKKQVNWDEVLCQNALDETGTVSTEGLSEARSFDSTIATEFTERLEIEGVTEEILSVHGMTPRKNQRESHA